MCKHEHPENPIHDSASFKIQSHVHHVHLLLSCGLLWAGRKGYIQLPNLFQGFSLAELN